VLIEKALGGFDPPLKSGSESKPPTRPMVGRMGLRFSWGPCNRFCVSLPRCRSPWFHRAARLRGVGRGSPIVGSPVPVFFSAVGRLLFPRFPGGSCMCLLLPLLYTSAVASQHLQANSRDFLVAVRCWCVGSYGWCQKIGRDFSVSCRYELGLRRLPWTPETAIQLPRGKVC